MCDLTIQSRVGEEYIMQIDIPRNVNPDAKGYLKGMTLRALGTKDKLPSTTTLFDYHN